MAGERFVVLGLARARRQWFADVGRWSTSAALPAEFLRCVSVEELRARLNAGRPYSCALLDGGLTSVDRDLVQAVRNTGAVVMVVEDGRQARDWIALGAAAVLPATLTREALLDALATHATMVGSAAAPSAHEGPRGRPLDLVLEPSKVAVVCGPGGTGASTVAAALAQGLGEDPGHQGPVVLADMARHGEQAMLHDVRDVTPGIQELVEAHRAATPSAGEVEALTFSVVERRYHLLLGLRHARYWPTLRPRAFEAAFDSLRRVFAAVVCDVTADFEGEEDAGSADVEERNLMARTAVTQADVVFAVGRPGAKGIHALVRVIADLGDHGVSAGRIVPVMNTCPRHPRARAEIASTLADLVGPALNGEATAGCVFVPSRRVEEALRDAVKLPSPLAPLLAGSFLATAERAGTRPYPIDPEPVAVAPGSLPTWSGDGGV